MRYLEEINTGYIAQHLGYMDSPENESVRKQAAGRSQAYGKVSFGSVRELVLDIVIQAWFESWYWQVVGAVSHYAEHSPKAYTQGSEREENWFYNYIIQHYPTLASADVLRQLDAKLKEVFRGGDFSRQEIGDKLIEHANSSYCRGVIGAADYNDRGLRAEWADGEIRHKLNRVGEPWY